MYLSVFGTFLVDSSICILMQMSLVEAKRRSRIVLMNALDGNTYDGTALQKNVGTPVAMQSIGVGLTG